MTLGILIIVAVLGVTTTAGLWFRHYRGPGRRPVSPIALARHRGRAPGTIVEMHEAEGRQDGSLKVAYVVDGSRYELWGRFKNERRGYYADSRYSLSMGMSVPTKWREYDTTSLGDICAGGAIVVAYRSDDPADAVLVPNPHRPLVT